LDAMHDITEGIGPFFFKLCVGHCSINNVEYGITAEFLNQRITTFIMDGMTRATSQVQDSHKQTCENRAIIALSSELARICACFVILRYYLEIKFQKTTLILLYFVVSRNL